MADGAGQGQVTGNVLMYGQPEALNAEQHGKLGVKRSNEGFTFAKDIHFVPVNANEFGVAATSFPIIFAGDEKQPLAIMGLKPGENLFIDEEDSSFKVDSYVPGYIRRYPFVLAKPPQEERMIVCFDRTFPAISDEPDLPFFEDGKATEYVNNAIDFLKQYETQRIQTEQSIARLKELDLFETREVFYNPQSRGRPGESQKITEHQSINEQKVMALPPEVLKELAEKGILGVIYAHLISLLNWDKLIDMALIRAQKQGQTGAPSAQMPEKGDLQGATPSAKGGDVKA